MPLLDHTRKATPLRSGDNIIIDFVEGRLFIQRQGSILRRSDNGGNSYVISRISRALDKAGAKELAQVLADCTGLFLDEEERWSESVVIFKIKKIGRAHV